MVKSKKLLSLFLAVVMILSTFVVMASAYTKGDEIADGINYKYSVEKVDTVPKTAAGSAEWSADNIYAVSVWMKASMGVDNMTAPIHFDKTLFSPIMLCDGEVTYPYGAGFGVDDYYSNMSEGVVYAYAEGDYLNNTGMYKADGSNATTKALAKCIGLGNSNSAGVTIQAELVSPDHPLYKKWGAGLPDNAGVMYVNIDASCTAKGAYLNTITGINYDTNWNKMFTVYFESIADDVVGAEFGVYTDDCYTVDGNFDATGSGYYVGPSSYAALRPATNIVSNAVVEADAEPTIVNPLKGQIRFDKKDGAYAGTFDVRALATITEKDFNATFTDAATAEDMIEEIGFVFAAGSNVGTPDMAGVKALVENGTALSGYEKKTVDYISTGATNVAAGNYVFSCIVTDVPDADKADSLVAVGYIKWKDAEGTHYNYYPAAQEISFNALYTAHYNSAFPQA